LPSGASAGKNFDPLVEKEVEMSTIDTSKVKHFFINSANHEIYVVAQFMIGVINGTKELSEPTPPNKACSGLGGTRRVF
jgi:hypothetical protein